MKLRLPTLTLLVLVLLQTCSAIAGNNHKINDTFQEAAEFFNQGRYDTAASEYRKIIAQNGLSAEVLHNLGNSYAAAEQNGLAILSYLRAQRLAPTDADISGELTSLRKKMGLFEEEAPLLQTLVNFFDMNQWLLIALCCYMLTTLALLLHFFFRRAKWLRPCSLVTTAALCVCLFGAWQQYIPWQSGVITAPQTTLLMSPFESAASLGIIPEGSVVFDVKYHNGYHYVQDGRGRAGWVKGNSYEKINTSSASYAAENGAD